MKEIHKKYQSNKIGISYDTYPDENSSTIFCFITLLGNRSETKCGFHLSVFNLEDRFHPALIFTCYKFKGRLSFTWSK